MSSSTSDAIKTEPRTKLPKAWYVIMAILMPVWFFLIGSLLWDSMTRPPYREVLSKKLQETSVPQTLKELSVSEVRLDCPRSTKKVTGTFQFESLEGRSEVEVAGDTACTESGLMAGISQGGYVYAHENYKAELLTSEITKLIAKAQLQPNPGRRDNPELAQALMRDYSEQAKARAVNIVLFTCNKAGEPYDYRVLDHARFSSGEHGELQSTCTTAHQNFRVEIKGLRSSDELAFQLHEYNTTPEAVVRAVYQEFVNEGLEKSSF